MRLLHKLILAVNIVFAVGHTLPDDDPRQLFYDYATSQPEMFKIGNDYQNVKEKEVYDSNVLIKIRAFENDFEVNLHVNKDLLSENYVEIREEDGQRTVHKPLVKEMKSCHYQGNLKGYEGSWAALSICDGISGIFFDGTELYYVQPDLTGDGNSNFIFKGSDMKPVNFSCGAEMSDSSLHFNNMKDFQEQMKTKGKVIETSARSGKQLYFEIGIVDDNAEYVDKMKKDYNGLLEKNKQIVNMADAIYSTTNLKIKLVGIVVWQDNDKITMSSDPGSLVDNFAKYRKDNYVGVFPDDATVLLTYKGMSGGTTGVANLYSACSNSSAGMVVSDHTSVIGLVAQTMAHELGHSLGMPHDSNSCSCSAGRCVMDPISGNFTAWSSCSQNVLSGLETSLTIDCLQNEPKSAFN